MRFAAAPVLFVAGLLSGLELVLAGRYGYHRDELYFVVAGEHLDWGYVDQPPLTPLLARMATEVFGDSLVGLRVVPALMAGIIVVLVALIARELGGGPAAQVLAALCAATSGLVLVVGHMLSTATGDVLAWMLLIWLALRLFRTQDGRWWLPIGLTIGVALLNKDLIALLALGLLGGVLLTGPRQVLRSRWLPVGAAIALVTVAPNLWWQATHDWPQLTVASGISDDDGGENRAMFVPLQLLQLSPLFVPFAVVGAVRVWRTPWARSLLTAYAVIAVVVLVVGGKPYYALPPVLAMVAAGCQPVVEWARSAGRRAAVATAVLLAAVTSALFTLPVLPSSQLGLVNAVNAEQGEQVGWPELTQAMADAWAQIPPQERVRSVIFTVNYGEAGALWRYGGAHGLPKPQSGHMSFAEWGPPPDSMDGPVLLVHMTEADVERHFTGCRQVGEVDNGHDLDNEEQGAVIALCDGPSRPWSELWPDLRRFY
jgi:4-amino-4-deoxy-L-arabinose transferase-like glycosyltransferase